MEAKDTVMSPTEQTKALDKVPFADLRSQVARDILCEAQAEISFKAGYEQRQEVVNLLSKIAVELDTDQDRGQFYDAIHRLYHEWQEFLKSEGIE